MKSSFFMSPHGCKSPVHFLSAGENPLCGKSYKNSVRFVTGRVNCPQCLKYVEWLGWAERRAMQSLDADTDYRESEFA